MAKTGTFKKQNDGRYTGTINTLTIRATVELVPTERQDGNGPDFRAWAKGAEIGAAWMQESKAGNLYLSVKLDDPSLPPAIFCRLIKIDDAYQLLWSR